MMVTPVFLWPSHCPFNLPGMPPSVGAWHPLCSFPGSLLPTDMHISLPHLLQVKAQIYPPQGGLP